MTLNYVTGSFLLPPSLHYLSSLPQMCIHTRSRASWRVARERPCSLSAETALSDSVSRLRGGNTSFHSNTPSYSHHAPASASATSSIRTATKVNSLAPSKRRPMLLCWHSVCANRLHRGRATRRTDWASFTEGNCTGAKWCTFVMRFFPALLKPCLDLFTLRMELLWQGHTISSDKHKHVSFKQERPLTLTGYLPTVLLIVYTWAWNNMTLVWSGALKMLEMKRLMNSNIFRVTFWPLLNPVSFHGFVAALWIKASSKWCI